MITKEERRGQGICDYCDAPVKQGRFVCVTHAREQSERVKKAQHARLEAGLCRYCDSPPIHGITACEKHARASRFNQKKNSVRRKTVGLCAKCNEPRIEGRSKCKTHLEEAANRETRRRPSRKLQREARRAAGLCHYCKEFAEQGKATCLYHSELYRSYEKTEKRRAYKAGKGRYLRARSQAVARFGAEYWTLTREEYDALVLCPCIYCGFDNKGTHGGLDRIDNDEGYHSWNVVSCCTSCNEARNRNFSFEQMKRIGATIREVKIEQSEIDAWEEDSSRDGPS